MKLPIFGGLIALKWPTSYKILLRGNCPDLNLRMTNEGAGGVSLGPCLAEEEEAQNPDLHLSVQFSGVQ